MAKRTMDMAKAGAPTPKKPAPPKEDPAGCVKGCVLFLVAAVLLIMFVDIVAGSVLTSGTGG